jgi:hypothetical protein
VAELVVAAAAPAAPAAVLAELAVVEAVLLHRPAGLVVAAVPRSRPAEPVAVARRPVRAPVVAAAQLRRLAPAAPDALGWAAARIAAAAPACAASAAAAPM